MRTVYFQDSNQDIANILIYIAKNTTSAAFGKDANIDQMC